MEVRSDRTYRFDVAVDALWDAVRRVHEYRRWWPWLQELDGGGFDVGDRWDCTVSPPLPYRLRFTIELTHAEPPTRLCGRVSGDIVGEATLVLRATPAGCEAQLRSVLSPGAGSLRVVARVAPWLARYGHDWVLDNGFEQFRARALH